MMHPTSDQLLRFLNDSADEQVAAHLESCAECRHQLDQLASSTEPDWSVLRRPEIVASAKALSALREAAKNEVASVPSRWSRAGASQQPKPNDDKQQPIDGYELLEPLERGGMGRVFKARQLSLNRIVALKMLEDDDGDRKARFRTEAEAIAQLQHPSIVQIFDVGEHQGRPFFTMEFASHGTLARAIAGRPQDPRLAADFARQLADAVQFAHDARVLHRDIKPANVLLFLVESRETSAEKATSRLSTLDSRLSPKLADFGLAKRMGDLRQTISGVMLGTPGYVAPEQVLSGGHAIGPAADLFGLGAVLYEMLTGRPPYLASSWDDMLAALQREEVVRPRLLEPAVPPELEWICLKCLRRDPRRRYTSARALADDLRRFLAGERIQARPPSAWSRVTSWSQRHPAATVLYLLLIAMMIGTQAASVWFWRSAAMQRDLERTRRESLSNERDLLATQVKDTEAELTKAREAEQHATAAQRAAESRLDKLLIQQVLKLAESQLKLGQRWQARDTLLEAPATLRNAAWQELFRQVHPQVFVLPAVRLPATSVYAAAFSADGRYLATAAGVPEGIKFLADVRGSVRIWDLHSGKVVMDLGNKVGSVVCLAFSPDGQRLATAEMSISGDWMGSLRQWDVATGQELRTFGERRSFIQIGYSPDGQYLAAKFPLAESLATGILPARGGPGEFALFDATTGEQKLFLTAQWNGFFHATSQRLTTLSGDGTLTHHNLQTAETSTGATIPPTAFLTPNGERACYLDDQWLRIHSTSTGQLQYRIPRHSSTVTCLAISSDSQLLAAPGDDHHIRVWHLATGKQLAEFTGHLRPLLSLTFNPAATLLASTSGDGTARVWSLMTEP